MFGKHLLQVGRQSENGVSSDAPGLWQRMELRLQPEDEAGPLWPRLEERLAAVRSYPHLYPGLVLKPVPAAEGAGYLLSDPARGRYFRLGEREASILPLLDGKHELHDVVQESSARLGPVSLPAMERFLQDLRLAGLLDEGASLWQRLGSFERSGPLILWTLPGAEGKIAALHRSLRFLFAPAYGTAVLLLLLVVVPLAFAIRPAVVAADLAVLRSAWWPIPLLLALAYIGMVPVVLTHELAHALACVHAGGRVARFGLMVKHLLPAAFADVSDVWTLPRHARVRVFTAGPTSTVLWSILAILVWICTPAGTWVHLAGGALALACWYTALVGTLPVAGYDGSEVLSEWLAIPDLHRRALGLFRMDGGKQGTTTPRERRILRGYAAGFVAYNVLAVGLVGVAVWRAIVH